MSIPQHKDELREAIESSYQRLKAELESVPESEYRTKSMEGHAKGTAMSVSDLVAYLIGWGKLVLKWNQIIERGETPDFPETGYQWNELGKLAQKFYADYEKEDYQTLLRKLDGVVEDILTLIESKDNQTLYGTTWYKQYTMGRMIQLNTASPYKNAFTRIRKWKKQNNM